MAVTQVGTPTAAVSTPAWQVGAWLWPAYMNVSTWAEASSAWTTLTGQTLPVARWYKDAGDYTYDTTMQAMVAAGVKICLTLRPDYDPTSSTVLASIQTLMEDLQAASANVEVTLWHEPYYEGLTASQYIAMVEYYGPTVREYYPLVFVTSAWSVYENDENSYYPGDAYVDKCATDFYATFYDAGATLALAASPADSASPPKPFGIWELGTSTDPAVGQTTTETDEFFTYVQDYMNTRYSGGQPNADVLWFNGGGYNLLSGGNTGVDASFEGGVGDWLAFTNCSIAASTAQANSGTSSLAITATAAGNVAAGLYPGSSVDAVAVTAGDTYTLSAWFRAATTARNCIVDIDWYTSGGTYISSSYNTGVTDSTSGWVQSFTTGTAPSTAAYADLQLQVQSLAKSEVHYVDDVLFTIQHDDSTIVGMDNGSAESSDYRIPLYNSLVTAAASPANFAPVGSVTTIDADTFTLSPSAVGDLIIAVVISEEYETPCVMLTGGGCTWQQISGTYPGGDIPANNNACVTVFAGIVTSTTADQTVTLSFYGDSSGVTIRGVAQEFSSVTAGWEIDTQGYIDNASGTDAFPSLTPAGSSELYFGYAYNSGSGADGSTTGYTYGQDAHGNTYLYNVNCGTGAQAPTTGDSGNTFGAAVLVKPAATLPPISPVGPWWDFNGSGSSLTSGTSYTAQVGDLMTLLAIGQPSTVSVTAVSGGACDDWTLVKTYAGPNSDWSGSIWLGTVSSVSSAGADMTVTWSSTPDDGHIRLQEFQVTGGEWHVDTSGYIDSASGQADWPALTASGSGELYIGYSYSTGTTVPDAPGWTYGEDSDLENTVAFNYNVGPGTITPVMDDTGEQFAVAVLIASGASTSENAAVTGVDAAVTTEAIPGTVTATTAVTIPGTIAGVITAATIGTVITSASVSGSPALVTVSGVPGTVLATQNVSMSASPGAVGVAATPGAVSATQSVTVEGAVSSAIASAVPGSVSATQSSTVSGSAAQVTASGTAGNVSTAQNTEIAGATAVVTVSAVPGSVLATKTVTVSGSVVTVLVDAIPGAVSGSAAVTGVPASVDVTSSGTVTAIRNIAISGPAATVTTTGVPGSASTSGNPVVRSEPVSVSAGGVAGSVSAIRNPAITGPGGAVTASAVAGYASTSTGTMVIGVPATSMVEATPGSVTANSVTPGAVAAVAALVNPGSVLTSGNVSIPGSTCRTAVSAVPGLVSTSGSTDVTASPELVEAAAIAGVVTATRSAEVTGIAGLLTVAAIAGDVAATTDATVTGTPGVCAAVARPGSMSTTQSPVIAGEPGLIVIQAVPGSVATIAAQTVIARCEFNVYLTFVLTATIEFDVLLPTTVNSRNLAADRWYPTYPS